MNINISTIFLLPGIDLKPELKAQFKSFGFISTYLTCEPLKYPYNVIFLLFKPHNLDHDFYEFTEKLQRNVNFIEFIELNEKIICVYRIPRKFNKDYEYFMKGQYSRLSKEFRNCFVLEDYRRDDKGNPIKEKGKFITEYTTFYHIFNKSEVRRDDLKNKLGYNIEDNILDDIELYDKQDEEKENYITDIDLW